MTPNRKIIRLKNYDYSTPGYYFVTVCVKNHSSFFGNIENGKMVLNAYGEIVKNCWQDLINHYRNCNLDEFIVMPNHFHGILVIENVGNGLKPFPTHGLSEIIRGFKTFSSRKINELTDFRFQWQKSFYEHVIRKNESLDKIREYIQNNPKQWELDTENPKNIKT
jgi:putative transposase